MKAQFQSLRTGNVLSPCFFKAGMINSAAITRQRVVSCKAMANSDRREALVAMVAAIAAFPSPPAMAIDEEILKPVQASPIPTFKHLSEPILAYEFDYPASTASGKDLPLVFSRRPERYSSAAPLTADARQRIVCELADLIDAVTVTVSVGPPAGTLRSTPQEQWTAKQVAEQVLIDRSTARVTSGQRVSLNTVEDAAKIEKNGSKYYVYEHISQGSPTLMSATRETYRHALAVTAVRPGLDGSLFLYTLNMACPQPLWDDVETGFRRAVESFTLVEKVGPEFVSPESEPWRFF